MPIVEKRAAIDGVALLTGLIGFLQDSKGKPVVRKPKAAWCGVEELERRVLLSAAPSNLVTISFPSSSTIQITGDKFDNHIVVSGDSGNLTIQGADGTTLKLPSKHPAGFTQDSVNQITGPHALDHGAKLVITTAAGDDFVEIQNFNASIQNPSAAPNSLKVDAGVGYNTIAISDSLLKDLAAVAGKGTQGTEVDIVNTTVRGATNISLGTAADSNSIGISGSDFKGAFKLTTFKGDDDVSVDSSTFESSVQMALGAGSDTINLEDHNVFNTSVSLDGGPASNFLFDDGTSLFKGKTSVLHFKKNPD